jgi:regulator of RNase E activity RraB
MYREIINRLLSLSGKYGGKSGHDQSVEFFFYADTEDRAGNLAIELTKKGYEVYQVEKSGKKWSIIGCTSPILISENNLTKWSEAMNDLANEFGAEYDGCGMLIE